VVGPDRLPTFEDRDNLTYVNAVVSETLRGHPIAPLGLPRIAQVEDEFQGYRIPKGAMILPSIGWFSQDPTVYHKPKSFKPERYFEPYNEPNPRSFVFGFGRRICPGRLLADSTIFVTIAQTLAVFDIRKGIDENGREIEPPLGATPGVVSHPLPFQCRLVPRSEKHAELIRSVEIQHPWEEGDAKFLDALEHEVTV
jgi:cytochrome P450